MVDHASEPTTLREDCDILILGAGPAGSTAAALLAARGWDAVIVEKERHPRFHIGESLLPLNLPLFEKLGVADRVQAVAMHKYGAEFISPQHDYKSMTFEFANQWDKAHPLAYQ